VGKHRLRQIVFLALQLAQFPLKSGNAVDVLVKVADCLLDTGNFRFGVCLRFAGLREFLSLRAAFSAVTEVFLAYLVEQAFFPRIGGKVFRTLEVPTTLPTLDELIGRPEHPDGAIPGHLVSLLRPDRLNVLTLHAEIEGMGRRAIFREFLGACRSAGVSFVALCDEARALLADRGAIPACDQAMAAVDGRSGLVATQVA